MLLAATIMMMVMNHLKTIPLNVSHLLSNFVLKTQVGCLHLDINNVNQLSYLLTCFLPLSKDLVLSEYPSPLKQKKKLRANHFVL